MNKRRLIIILIITCLIAVFVLLSLTSWEKLEQEHLALEPTTANTVQVSCYTVSTRQISDWTYAEAPARVNRKAHLTFEVDGRVIELAEIPDHGIVREGLEVTGPKDGDPGSLLARIYDQDYSEELLIARSNLTQAERTVDVANAGLAQSQSRLELAKLEFKRHENLLSTRTISRQRFDQIKSELEITRSAVVSARAELASANAALQSARNALSQAERNYSRTRIYAPWSGTIARVNIDLDEYFSVDSLDITTSDRMSATFPITLIDRSKFRIEAEIPMDEAHGLVPGCTAELESLSGGVNGKATASRPIPAEIYTVAPALSPDSRTIRVTLMTTAPFPDLIDGELVSIKILKETKSTHVLPLDSIIYRENIPHVFIIDNANISRLRQITTGIRDNNLIEVTTGLNDGDRVATRGRQRLQDGMRVTALAEENPNEQR